jgi:type I restriction-modification system DNA methylase subunit
VKFNIRDFLKISPKKKTVIKVNQPKLNNKEKLKPETFTSSKPMPKKLIGEHIDHKKEFMKIFNKLTHRHRPWDIWSDFIVMFACSISNAVDKSHYDEREAQYMRLIKKYNKHEQNLFPSLIAETVMVLEHNQEQDFLGEMFMELKLGNERTAQFFTPYDVCVMMAAMTLGDVSEYVKENGYITINDPCCGAGANLIAGIHEAKKQLEKAGYNYQNHVLIVGQDIDSTVALMCYIQISLLGMAGFIKIGNTLTEPMAPDDDLKSYWFTPMYFSEIWTTRRIFNNERRPNLCHSHNKN